MERFALTIEGYEVLEKTVVKSGNSGAAPVPKSWRGKRVKVVLLEPLEPDT